jgi:hypothetical protein
MKVAALIQNNSASTSSAKPVETYYSQQGVCICPSPESASMIQEYHSDGCRIV